MTAAQSAPRLPGTRALAALARARADGLEIKLELLEQLRTLAVA